MKRCWFGAAVLVLLLILGLLCSAWTGRFFREEAQRLDLAADAGPEEAMVLARTAQSRWERRRRLYAALYDHTPLEEIDTLFALLDPQADTFRENCIRLSRALYALAQSQQPDLENVF